MATLKSKVQSLKRSAESQRHDLSESSQDLERHGVASSQGKHTSRHISQTQAFVGKHPPFQDMLASRRQQQQQQHQQRLERR
mmetsp:Transcript_23367/g.49833  ORF Transcript_23367/g.49833 Transcript_23367/m.49833 type:complete len:82 (-) Transcript_23367:207-452(-)